MHGLCAAYSGRQLLIYDQNNGLPNNNIYHITEDGNGKIWVACYGGIKPILMVHRLST